MSLTRLKNIIQKEVTIFSVCLIIGLSFAIMGRIIGGKSNSGQIFFFATFFFSGLLYFSIQSIRAIGWSILNLIRH